MELQEAARPQPKPNFEPFDHATHWPSLKLTEAQAAVPVSARVFLLLANGPACALVLNGETLGAFGLCDHPTPGLGFFWCYPGREIGEHSSTFIRQMRLMLEANEHRWPEVTAFVLHGDEEGARVLRHIGFTPIGRAPVRGARNEERIYVEYRRTLRVNTSEGIH